MRQPANSRTVLAVAMLLPGGGHVLAGMPARGLGFACFTIILGWLSTKFAAPDANFIGQHAGGFFVWALSITDAYRCARLREARADLEGVQRAVIRADR